MIQTSVRPRARRPGARLAVSIQSRIAIAIMAVFTVLAFRAPEHFLALAAGGSLSAIILLLWRQSEPPVILFPVLYQWSEVALKPILSAIYVTPVNELAEFNGNIEAAAYFGLAAVVALAAGMRFALRGSKGNLNDVLEREVANLPFSKILRISLAILIIGYLFGAAAKINASLAQPLLALGSFSHCGLFALSYWCLKNRRGYLVLALVMLLEIGVGLTGFFAEFRAPLLILCIAALSARPRMKLGDVLLLTAILAILISIASFWSYVKKDYRYFASGGSDAQVITTSLQDRAGYLLKEAENFNGEKYVDGLQKFFDRHSYIDFLSKTMEYVPYQIPHQHGARLTQTIVHVLTPRILFPNKPATESDTEVTEKYTGLSLYTSDATSISLGYLGELYIDFGYSLSVVCCFIAGLIYGTGYRSLRDSKGPLLLRFGMCVAFCVVQCSFGTALIKLVGGIVATWVGAWAAQRFVLPSVLRAFSPRPRKPQLAVTNAPLR